MGIIFRQSFKNTLIIYLGFLIGGINTIFLYTRFLKSDYYGLVQFVFSASNLIMPLIALGIHFTIVKFFSSYTDKVQRDKFLSSVLFLPLFVAIPIAFGWNYIHEFLIDYISKSNQDIAIEDYTLYIYVIAICCAYFEVFYSWAKVQLQTVFGNVLKELYNRVITMLLLIAVFLGVITKQQFIPVITGFYVLRTLLMLGYASKLYLPKFSLSLPDNYKEVLRYSLYIFLAGSAGAIILDIDKFMIPGKETFSKAAYYTVAVFLGSFIEAPSRAMTQILQPMTSKSINENNSDEVKSLYKKSSINLLLVGGLFFTLINTNVKELFKIMPDRGYADGLLVVLFISLAKLVTMTLGNNGAIINNSRFYRISLPLGVFMALSVYFLNKYFYFTLNMGTEGLALATLITILLSSLFKVFFVRGKFKMQPFTGKTVLLGFLILMFYLGFNFWDFSVPKFSIGNVPIDPLVNIILKSILIIPLYVGLVYQLKISEQINTLISRFVR